MVASPHVNYSESSDASPAPSNLNEKSKVRVGEIDDNPLSLGRQPEGCFSPHAYAASRYEHRLEKTLMPSTADRLWGHVKQAGFSHFDGTMAEVEVHNKAYSEGYPLTTSPFIVCHPMFMVPILMLAG